VALNIFVTESSFGIDLLDNPAEVVEPRIQFTKPVWLESVGLRPVGPTTMANDNIFESLEELSIWDVEPVRPSIHTSINEAKGRSNHHSLILYNADPGRNLAITWTQPNIVAC